MNIFRRNNRLLRHLFLCVVTLLLSSYAASITGFVPIAYANHEAAKEDLIVQITKPVAEGSMLLAGSLIIVEGIAFDNGHVKLVKVKVDDGLYKITKKGDSDWSTWSTIVDIK